MNYELIGKIVATIFGIIGFFSLVAIGVFCGWRAFKVLQRLIGDNK